MFNLSIYKKKALSFVGLSVLKALPDQQINVDNSPSERVQKVKSAKGYKYGEYYKVLLEKFRN